MALSVALRIDHEEKPRDCVSVLGVTNTRQEADKLVADSIREDLRFELEALGDGGPMDRDFAYTWWPELLARAGIFATPESGLPMLDDLSESQLLAVLEVRQAEGWPVSYSVVDTPPPSK